MNSAIGMVAPTVKMPQGLSARALTTTSARTASKMTRMERMASSATQPAVLFNSSRTSLRAERIRRVAAQRAKQNDEILHRSAQDHADQNPERARQIPKLRGQHWPDQRAGTGNGGEMVSEDNPFIRLDKVLAVVVNFAGRGAAVVEHQDARRNPFGIEAVADGVAATTPPAGYRMELISSPRRKARCKGRVGPCAKQRDEQPGKLGQELLHRANDREQCVGFNELEGKITRFA